MSNGGRSSSEGDSVPITHQPPSCQTPELARARYRLARGAGHDHTCAAEFGRSADLNLRDACVCMRQLVKIARLRGVLAGSRRERKPSALTRLARQLA